MPAEFIKRGGRDPITGERAWAVIRCDCGELVELIPSGPMGDTYCDRCDQCWNSSGQHIAFPQGQGEDYCGERWEEE